MLSIRRVFRADKNSLLGILGEFMNHFHMTLLLVNDMAVEEVLDCHSQTGLHLKIAQQQSPRIVKFIRFQEIIQCD